MTRFTEASIDSDGVVIDSWTSYRIDSDLLTPADAFTFELAEGSPRSRAEIDRRRELVDLVAPGRVVRVLVGQAVQMTGRIDAREVRSDARDGFRVTVRGRDLAAQLVDSSVDISLQVQQRTMRRARRRRVTREVAVVEGIVDARPPLAPPTLIIAQDGGTQLDIATEPGSIGLARALAPDGAEAFTRTQRMAQVIEYETVPAQVVVQDVPFVDLVREAVGDWQIEVVASSEAARSIRTGAYLRRGSREETGGNPWPTVRSPEEVEDLRLDDAKPRPGETVWSFLDRHARRLGLMLWMAPDGRLIVSEPDYNTPPAYRFVRRYLNDSSDPNNVLDGDRATDWSQRFGSVLVLGRGGGRDVARRAIKAATIDPAFPFVKELVVHDPSLRTTDECVRRGYRELAQRSMDSDVLTYTVPGHGQTERGRPNERIYATDTVASVEDEVTGARGEWYVFSRSLMRDAATGTKTVVRLMPKGALVL